VLDINDVVRGDDSLLQRAHLVLAWLTHYFVHSIPDAETLSSIHIPESIAVPLVEVSRLLGTAPVLTYADTILYNWDLIDPSKPVSADNITYSNLFSGTEAEKNFYLISAKTELVGAELLQIIDRYNGFRDATDFASLSAVAKDLSRAKNIISDISVTMQELRSACDPHVFYWAVRPWFDGADAKGLDGPEWIYDGVSSTRLLDTSGPSGGQSSTMHAIDIFLDIDHRLRQRRYPAPSSENKRSDKGFMDRMRRYMPGKHREYLQRLAATPHPVRELAQRHQILRSPYDEAVTALKDLRDEHIRIVCLYIVNMKRNGSRGMCPMMKRTQMIERTSSPVRGTGGTELALLLKAGRDATKRATLQSK
jgi:indoleamine 2,3-dioxygenase